MVRLVNSSAMSVFPFQRWIEAALLVTPDEMSGIDLQDLADSINEKTVTIARSWDDLLLMFKLERVGYVGEVEIGTVGMLDAAEVRGGKLFVRARLRCTPPAIDNWSRARVLLTAATDKGSPRPSKHNRVRVTPTIALIEQLLDGGTQ